MNTILSEDRRSKFWQLYGALADNILSGVLDIIERRRDDDNSITKDSATQLTDMVQYNIFLLHMLRSNNEKNQDSYRFSYGCIQCSYKHVRNHCQIFDSPDLEKTIISSKNKKWPVTTMNNTVFCLFSPCPGNRRNDSEYAYSCWHD